MKCTGSHPKDRGYTALPDLTSQASPDKVIGVHAMALIQKIGLYDALKVFNDPQQEFLEAGSSGLHILGITRQGLVFLDNSGQTKAGMDISALLDLEGNSLLNLFLNSAQAEGGGDFLSRGVWPNPITNQVAPMSGWCGSLSQNDILCVLSWQADAGGGE